MWIYTLQICERQILLSKRIKSLTTMIYLKAIGGKKALFSRTFYSTIMYEEKRKRRLEDMELTRLDVPFPILHSHYCWFFSLSTLSPHLRQQKYYGKNKRFLQSSFSLKLNFCLCSVTYNVHTTLSQSWGGRRSRRRLSRSKEHKHGHLYTSGWLVLSIFSSFSPLFPPLGTNGGNHVPDGVQRIIFT